MYADSRIANGLQDMLREIEVPPISLANIHRRMVHPTRDSAKRAGFYLTGAAAAALLLAALPVVAPAFVQSLEARIETVLRWSPPPPPPVSVASALRSQTGTLAKAQSHAKFTIVPPVGLPRDITSETIATMPGAVYSTSTHAWSVGSSNVWFTFHRKGGATFQLMAEAFDPREGAPSKYMFEDQGARNGEPILIRREKFVWRNGNQVMSAITGEGIAAPEIIAIRSAMRGSPIIGIWPPRHGTVKKMYLKP